VRQAVPDAAILVMSPMDRGVKDDEGNISTAETIPQVVEIQKRVAAEMNVAFFNTFAAMGGAGTMAKWYASNPRLVGSDYIHPMPAGAKLVGDLLFDGIEQQYRMYKLKELRKTLPQTVAKGKQG
jgi:lysophospholipase L1-like esterase